MSGRLDDLPYDVAELVSKAELDYLTVQRLDLPLLAEPICFHCQQCAEKYLKALISLHGEVPERIHDLIALHARTVGLAASLDDLLPDLALLNPFAVAMRYEGTAKPEMACRAIAAMERVRAVLREALGIEEPEANAEGEAEERGSIADNNTTGE